MDAGGLDGKGIDGVDVGHNDRTIIKRFAFLFCCLSLLQTTLLPYYFCCIPFRTLSYAFKLISFQNGFNRNEILNRLLGSRAANL